MELKEVILYKDGGERDFYLAFCNGMKRAYENLPYGIRDHLVEISFEELERIVLPELFESNGEDTELWIINHGD